MKKLLIAALPFVTLLTGCIAGADTTDGDESTEEAQSALTSFFGSGDATNPACVPGAPIVKNPSYSNGRVYVDAAGSCIMSGATMTLLVPWSTTTYGPYSLSFDDSGTRLRTPTLGPSIVPAGSCRIVSVMNPNGKTSNLPSFCR